MFVRTPVHDGRRPRREMEVIHISVNIRRLLLALVSVLGLLVLAPTAASADTIGPGGPLTPSPLPTPPPSFARVMPQVTCVGPHGKLYDVRFGYTSTNAGPVLIPHGTFNRLAPAGNGTQPETFAPGAHPSAVTVADIPQGTPEAWELGGHLAVANFPARQQTPALCETKLTVAKTVSNAMPHNGDTIQWTVTVSNAGKFDAFDVVVTDILPAGNLFVTASKPYDPLSGTWKIGHLAAGTSATLVLTAIVNSPAMQTNCASVMARNAAPAKACAAETPPGQPTPTPTGNPTPTATPTPVSTPTPGGNPTPTPASTPTPTPAPVTPGLPSTGLGGSA